MRLWGQVVHSRAQSGEGEGNRRRTETSRDVRSRGRWQSSWSGGSWNEESASACVVLPRSTRPCGTSIRSVSVHSHPGQATLPTSRKHPFASIACAATSAATAPAATRTSDRIGDGAEDEDAPAVVVEGVAVPPAVPPAEGLEIADVGEDVLLPYLEGLARMRCRRPVSRSV